MNILAFDTALGRGAVGVFRNGEPVSSLIEHDQRTLAERLVPMIEQALVDAAMTYADLDRIGVTVGPGTFTGLRIGVATARGLMLATAVPAIGVSTLQALAATHAREANVGECLTVVHDARRGQVFIQSFSVVEGRAAPCTAAVACDLQDARAQLPSGAAVLIGSAAEEVAGLDSHRQTSVRWVPATADIELASLAREIMAATMTGEPPRPLYLRAPDARLPGGVAAA
ncbi:MAG: tRNA (adenosine(37)-N6)-threonylcarbamoyltransferase complex dimerization subunit type 1 TsaB [Proteobacteria bacterium]|nr:tRNA (adenosine(37)-N6)-threonylcarbamoyltransferase complex dimerization subunit type 1 TsaB [Pseudomonadota bacterium]